MPQSASNEKNAFLFTVFAPLKNLTMGVENENSCGIYRIGYIRPEITHKTILPIVQFAATKNDFEEFDRYMLT
jgi:hypothetical protein